MTFYWEEIRIGDWLLGVIGEMSLTQLASR
jgi:hypothetical protein